MEPVLLKKNFFLGGGGGEALRPLTPPHLPQYYDTMLKKKEEIKRYKHTVAYKNDLFNPIT